MTFTIDTGTSGGIAPLRQGLYDAFTDHLPPDAPQEAIDRALAEGIIADISRPKTLKTVRRKLLAHWRALTAMADTTPDAFDTVLTVYVEITQSLDP